MSLIDPTLNPVVLPPAADFGFLRYPDAQPFSQRTASAYQESLEQVIFYLQRRLWPYLQAENRQDVWDGNAQTLIEAVNTALADQASAVSQEVSAALLSVASAAFVAPVATGVAATDTANLQAAITAAQEAARDLLIPGGTTAYVLNAGLVWDISRGSMLGEGRVDLDGTGLTSGQALEVIGATPPGGYNSHRSATNRIRNLRIAGPQVEGLAVDGIVIDNRGATLVEPDHGSIEHVIVNGFRDGIVVREGPFCFKFDKVFVNGCMRRGISLVPGSGLGENNHFFGCTVSAVKNAASTGVSVYTGPTGRADAMFVACSFDYSDIEFDHHAGDITLLGCHIENSSLKPMVQLEAIATPVSMTVLGGTWSLSSASNRDRTVEVLSTSTGDVSFTVIGGAGGPSNQKTIFFVNSSTTSLPAVKVQNFPWMRGRNSGVDTATRLGIWLSALVNGDFESSTSFTTNGINGWAAGTLGGITRNIGTANAQTGNALRLVATGTQGTDVTYQWMRVRPNDVMMAAAMLAIPTYNAGSVGVLINYYAEDQATFINGQRLGSSLSAATSYQTVNTRHVVPKGAAWAQVRIECTNLDGVVAIDNVQAALT